jgi:hypothetical protein
MFFPDDDNTNNDSSLTTPLLSSTPTSTTTTNNNNSTTMEYHEIDQESAPLVANSGDNHDNTGTTDIVAIDAVDTWRQRLIRYQRNCIMISYVLSLFCLLVVISWIHRLGGLSFKKNLQSKQVFNWHPLLMTTSFVGVQTIRPSQVENDPRIGLDGRHPVYVYRSDCGLPISQ